jgi:hypothetical protein
MGERLLRHWSTILVWCRLGLGVWLRTRLWLGTVKQRTVLTVKECCTRIRCIKLIVRVIVWIDNGWSISTKEGILTFVRQVL